MPSTGTPSSNTHWGAAGAAATCTDSGPPDRMMPRAPKARTSSSLMSHGCISQYTPLSRTRRAMSCVYCAPKSRIRMRCAWMSAPGVGTAAEVRALRAAIPSRDAVIGRLLGDRDIVHVALAHARAGDAPERGPRTHLLDVVAARVAHRGTQATGELIENRDEAALVGHAALDALGHELLELAGRVLEIAVRRAMAV